MLHKVAKFKFILPNSVGVTYEIDRHTRRPPDTQSANILHSMPQGLLFKIGYVCKIPKRDGVGHIWPTTAILGSLTNEYD